MKFISFCFKSFSPAVKKFLVIIGLSTSLAACQWGDEVVSLVQPNPDDFAALFSDSTTVRLSTVAADSIMTGSASRLFVGRLSDPYFGIMRASSFFQPTLNGAVSLSEQAVYDSLTLSLQYDGYYYGDTTKLLNLSVHALQEDITLKNVYYNGNTTPYDATPLAKVSFYPNPRPTARVPKKIMQIKLSSALGQQIFALAKSNLLTSNSQWINLLKGIVIIPDLTNNQAVVGFSAGTTSLKMFYHTSSVDGETKDSSLFSLTAIYNQVLGDRSKTLLAKLPQRRLSLPTSQTGELAFIQSGSGIMTRVDLPTIRQLKDVKYSYANRAYLRITPVYQSATEQFKAPATIYAYYCDNNNEYLQSPSTGFPESLSDLNGAAVTGPLINDMVNNKQYYLLDLSQYVSSILSSNSEQAAGLLLRASLFNTTSQNSTYVFPDLDSEYSKSFDRLVIGSQNNPTDKGVKLELYYTTAKAQ